MIPTYQVGKYMDPWRVPSYFELGMFFILKWGAEKDAQNHLKITIDRFSRDVNQVAPVQYSSLTTLFF